MIREISRTQIQAKVAFGEIVVLIDATPREEFDRLHITGALHLPPEAVRSRARSIFPSLATELVVYSRGPDCPLADEASQALAELGYGNVYCYRGGKLDWFGEGLFRESIHFPAPFLENIQYPPEKRDADAVTHGWLIAGEKPMGQRADDVLRRGRREPERDESRHPKSKAG